MYLTFTYIYGNDDMKNQRIISWLHSLRSQADKRCNVRPIWNNRMPFAIVYIHSLILLISLSLAHLNTPIILLIYLY